MIMLWKASLQKKKVNAAVPITSTESRASSPLPVTSLGGRQFLWASYHPRERLVSDPLISDGPCPRVVAHASPPPRTPQRRQLPHTTTLHRPLLPPPLPQSATNIKRILYNDQQHPSTLYPPSLPPPPSPVIDEQLLLAPCTEMASTAVVREPPRHSVKNGGRRRTSAEQATPPPPSPPTSPPSCRCSRGTATKKERQEEDAGTAGSRPRAVAPHPQL